MTTIFCGMYSEEKYDAIRKDVASARFACDVAELKSACVDVLEEGSDALHLFFMSGDFPKGCSEEHKQALLSLSSALTVLHKAVVKLGDK